jgi:hypothetical protein
LRKTDYFCLRIVGVTSAGSPKLAQGRNGARGTSTQDFQPLKPGVPGGGLLEAPQQHHPLTL